MWELVSFALIHEITYWVSVSDLSSSSWWNKRIPWNSTRSMWLWLHWGERRLLGKPCDLGPLPIQTAALLGACCGFLPPCTLVSFQKKSKLMRRWCTRVCVPAWGCAAHRAPLLCNCMCLDYIVTTLSGCSLTSGVFVLLNALTPLVKWGFQVSAFLSRTRALLQAGLSSLWTQPHVWLRPSASEAAVAALCLVTLNLLVPLHPVFTLFLMQTVWRWFGTRCALKACLAWSSGRPCRYRWCWAVSHPQSHSVLAVLCHDGRCLCTFCRWWHRNPVRTSVRVPGWGRGLCVLIGDIGCLGRERKQLQKRNS